METAIERGHSHGEAFMLMTYACDCGHQETIWNSRDGVTPFGLGCPSCGQPTLRHVDRRCDAYAPGHKLHKGQRFWRDGTPDEAEAIMRRRIERMQDQYPLDPAQAEGLIAASRDGSTGEFQAGWPTIDSHNG
jgi:hypothetical protein